MLSEYVARERVEKWRREAARRQRRTESQRYSPLQAATRLHRLWGRTFRPVSRTEPSARPATTAGA